MGMFDYVEYAANCRLCDRPLAQFQSKDGECRLELLQPSAVERFYEMCSCGAWNEFKVTDGVVSRVPPEDADWDFVAPRHPSPGPSEEVK